MTLTELRRFQVGDRVRVRNTTGARSPWTVMADDTGKTPVQDPEPAYRIGRQKRGSWFSRYAYESSLLLAQP